MRSSRSAAEEELLAAPHKKELFFFLFFLEEQKSKELHVQCSLGRAIWWRKEEERKKNGEMEWKRYGTSSASLENILHCWDLFAAVWRHLPHCCHIIPSSVSQLFCSPQKGKCVWKLNACYISTKSREELKEFFFMCIHLTLWMKITPPDTYRTISIIFLILPWQTCYEGGRIEEKGEYHCD